MPIEKGSRYEYSTVDYFATKKDQESEEPVVFYTFSTLGYVRFWTHKYVEGERLDQIAFKYYKKPEYWWIIPEYNPEVEDFTNIKPGTVLRIPNV
jgi:hypothetical protein